MVVSIWDDGYGISVPNEFQITKGDLSELLEGFRHTERGRPGLDLYTVRGWDYPALCETYSRRIGALAASTCRDRPRHRGDAAAGPLDLGQPRALQVPGAAALGGGVRLPAPDAQLDGRRAAPARPSSRRSRRRRSGGDRRARPRLGGLSRAARARAPRAPRSRSRDGERRARLRRSSACRRSRTRSARICSASPAKRCSRCATPTTRPDAR